jgi:DNA-binding CsgD family transcriptional regulator
MRRTRGAARVFADGVPPAREAILTPTELLMLKHLRAGATQRELARMTGRNENTVRVTVHRMRGKFQARSVPELLRGLDIGVYIVKRGEPVLPRSFDLATATAMLERVYRRGRAYGAMHSVRLHRAEILALLEIAGRDVLKLDRPARETAKSPIRKPPQAT